MRIKALKTFIYLAETGCNFDGHKALGIPRSNMWNHINEIENEIGLKLIERHRGKSFLTKQGVAFSPIARMMYTTYEEGLKKIVREEGPQIEGKIIISTTTAVAAGWLMPSIKDFYQNYPYLTVNIIADDYLDKSIAAGADILLRPIGNNPDLVKKWHIKYHMGLYASDTYLKDNGIPEVPEALLKHCIMGYGSHEFSYFEDINWHLKGKSWGLPKLEPTLTINSTISLFEAAAQGIGICSAAIESNAIYDENLTRVLPQVKGPVVKTHFCTKQNASASTEKNTDIFRQFFENYLESMGVKISYE
jgi:DNA-binding transcriptional LysR family regulator